MEQKPSLQARVRRLIRAAPEAVFDAWLSPDKVRGWFGPGLGEMVRVEAEGRVGGRFYFVQRRGNDDVEHTGDYLVFDRPHHLAFTWGVPKHTSDTSRVDVRFLRMKDGCEVELTHELHPSWADYLSRTEQAWAKMLDAMAGVLERQQPPEVSGQ